MTNDNEVIQRLKGYSSDLMKSDSKCSQNMQEESFPVPTIRKERKYDQSHGAMILRMRKHFELELKTGHNINLKKIVDRTASATGVSKSIVRKIKTEKDEEN